MSQPRKPGRATKGFRDRLVSELQAKGYKYEIARRAVGKVFDLMKQRRYRRLGKIVDIPQYLFRVGLDKKLPGPRRQHRPGPEKSVSQKRSLSSHPHRIAVVPQQNRYDVPSRTRGIKPGKR